MGHAHESCAPGERHYGLDWLRIAAFALLILYHIGLFFAPGVWLVKTPHPSAAIAWPMLTLEPWRLALLFVVSGYASHALLARTSGLSEFLRARSYRLLLPLAFGVLVIVPPETWIGMVENHGYSQSLVHFWTSDWLGFRTLNGVLLPATEHLWFVGYLWTYTMVLGAALALATPAWKRMGRALMDWLCVDHRLIWVPLLPILALRIAVLFTVPETHGLLHDWVSDVTYVPAFLFGFALAGHPQAWRAVHRSRLCAVLLAAISLLILVQIQSRFPGGVVSRTHWVQALDRDSGVVMAWAMILLLLGAAHQWLDRDHSLRPKLAEAVFPFYLAHQTIIVATAWRLKDKGLQLPFLFLILTLVTFAGCWAFYEVGRRTGRMRMLFGLSNAAVAKPHSRARPGSSFLPWISSDRPGRESLR